MKKSLRDSIRRDERTSYVNSSKDSGMLYYHQFFLSLKLIFALSLIYFLLFIDHSCRRMMYVVMGRSHVIIIYFVWYGQIQTVTFILLRCNLSYSSMFQYKIALKCIVGLMVCVRYMNFCSFVSLV